MQIKKKSDTSIYRRIHLSRKRNMFEYKFVFPSHFLYVGYFCFRKIFFILNFGTVRIIIIFILCYIMVVLFLICVVISIVLFFIFTLFSSYLVIYTLSEKYLSSLHSSRLTCRCTSRKM